MSRIGRALIVVLPLLVLLSLLARPALAADPFGVVTVDLRPQAGEVPTHICVVSKGQGPRARMGLAELLAPQRLADDTLAVLPTAWGRTEHAAASCTGSGGVSCVARVELPQGADKASDLHAACTSDTLLGSESTQSPRLLVLLIEHLEGSPPAIESLNLTGGVATIGVTANLRRVVVTARSLGGHYVSHERSYRAEQSGLDSTLIVLPIAPRCRTSDLVVPGARIRASDRDRMRLRVHGSELDVGACIGTLRGGSRISAQIPRASADGGSLEIFLDPREGEQPTATRFGGRWDGAWPPTPFELAAEQIGFTWQRPECVYPEQECPGAELEGGVQCEATSSAGACHYLCPGAGDDTQIVEIEFPVAVIFKKEGPRQTWTDILQRPGQTLTSYVAGDQIYLDADLAEWKTNVPGARITEFEILGNDGSVRRYGVGGGETLHVHVPGATCEPVRYKLVGDLHYKEGVARIRDGELDFGDALGTARLLSFNLTLAQGGGPGLVIGRPGNIATEFYFVGQVQLAANFRPRNPKYSRVAAELRLGGHVGQWGFYDVTTVGDDPRRVRSKIPWARFLFEPAIVVNVAHPMALSAGLAVGSSWPIRGSDVPTTDRFGFILSPSLDARFYVRRWLSFVLQGRVVLLERTSVVIGPETDLQTKMLPTVTLYGIYGVQFSF